MSEHKILPFQPKNIPESSKNHFQNCMEQTEISMQVIETMDEAFFTYLNQHFDGTRASVRSYMEKYYELCCGTTAVFMARALTLLPCAERQKAIQEFAENLRTLSSLMQEFSPDSFEETVQQAMHRNEDNPE